MITSFSGRWAGLSNFAPCRIVDKEGNVYASVEHAFQAAKTLDPAERAIVRACATPGMAKRAGRKVTMRKDWNGRRVAVMEYLLKQKFADPTYRALLLATGAEKLVEGNSWHDNFWGSCVCARCSGLAHMNTLGKLLMKVRAALSV